MKQSKALKRWSLGVKNATWWDVIKAYIFLIALGVAVFAGWCAPWQHALA